MSHEKQLQAWPDGALFKISYRTKSWPEATMGDTIHRYFITMDEVKYWEKDYASWARLGGNSVEYSLYQWGERPTLIKENWY